MTSCISCDMPLNEAHGFGTETTDGPVCDGCMGEDGHPKACDLIFEGGVQFFATVEGVEDRAFAERLTRKNMNQLPYWKAHGTNCLKGDEATDAEFYEVLGKL